MCALIFLTRNEFNRHFLTASSYMWKEEKKTTLNCGMDYIHSTSFSISLIFGLGWFKSLEILLFVVWMSYILNGYVDSVLGKSIWDKFDFCHFIRFHFTKNGVKKEKRLHRHSYSDFIVNAKGWKNVWMLNS